uniref:Lipocalin n=1 Tax=Rhipicephalus appendiculatus TaxID=34631 RepID=A0A131YRS0_RHIAP
MRSKRAGPLCVEDEVMAGMFEITVLALVLTAARTICNATEMVMQEPPGSTTGTAKPNPFKVFWTNHTKVWTAKSTDMFHYTCEREVLSNMNDTGLQITTYFDVKNSFTLNWTFTENDSITCTLSSNVKLRRQIIYENGTCAVLKLEVWSRNDSGSQENTYVLGQTNYKLVLDDKKKGNVPADCTQQYRRARGKRDTYKVYRDKCKNIEKKSQ